MKLIDEKGRLFGKLNLIDLAVVVIVVVAVAAVAMKVFGNKAVSAVTSQQVKLTYEVVAEDVPQHVADYCVAHTGGQLMSSASCWTAPSPAVRRWRSPRATAPAPTSTLPSRSTRPSPTRPIPWALRRSGWASSIWSRPRTSRSPA